MVDTLNGEVAVQNVEPLSDAAAVYNIEVNGHHVYRVADVGVLVHNSCTENLDLNKDNARSNFGIYEIEINDSLYKIGKADLDRVTQSTGMPTRLHQQVRKLERIFGRGRVIGRVVEDLGDTTTGAAKIAESVRITSEVQSSGFIPLGNLKSYRG